MVGVAVCDEDGLDLSRLHALGLQFGDDGGARGIEPSIDQHRAVRRAHDPGVGAAGLDPDHARCGLDPWAVGLLPCREKRDDGQERQENNAGESDEDLPFHGWSLRDTGDALIVPSYLTSKHGSGFRHPNGAALKKEARYRQP